MSIELQRTFGEYVEPQLGDNEVDWNEYFGSKRGRLTWKELHEKRVVVVLGEAGIGKTVEFQLEAKRLSSTGRSAFFLPLNALSTRDDWELALGHAHDRFISWGVGTEEAFFFLDAVDEARLKSHADFTRALRVVRGALALYMDRVRITISSRVTDWTVPDVVASVCTQLLQPINNAIALSSADVSPDAEQEANTETSVSRAAELFVATLDALSREEAMRCGQYFGLQDDDAFWAAVDDGDYDFMASRPLDLCWMVELWNQRKALGTYTELIEANIGARLSEVNPNYQQAGRALSEIQLRAGATELAAAAEFGQYAYIAVQQSRIAEVQVLDAHAVLCGWKPADIQLLLATAIFDEASFNRVKFHHRSIREYLAARWVDAKMTLGVPLGRLESLFAGRPYGEITLIPSRRPVLSWLAAINVRARGWVLSKFPELLLFEGDPQSWDQPSADHAFRALIEASKTNPKFRWLNSASEHLRVSRALGAGQIASVLCDPDAPWQARGLAWRLALHGKVDDCTTPAFSIYQDATNPEWERVAALSIIHVLGSPAHRGQLLADIESGALSGNLLIAHALPCIEWSSFTPARLAAILRRTQSEGKCSLSPMSQAVRDDMLPDADLASATLLLSAVLDCLPRPEAGKPFARFPVESQPERAWLLEVLPDCFQHVLDLARETANPPLQPCLEAAERIESMRDSGFTDRDEFIRLHASIKELPSLRWSIALAIAQSEDIRFSTSKLVWGDSCIVTFEACDLDELTSRAHASVLSSDVQEIWFQVGVEVAFSLRGGRERTEALRALCGPVNGSRMALVQERYKQRLDGARTRHSWKVKKKNQAAKRQGEIALFRDGFLSKLADIAEGADLLSLRRLMQFAFNCSAVKEHINVDLEAISVHLGPELATAFGDGLKAYWRKAVPPNPSDHPNGSVPWDAIVGVSGISLSAGSGIDFSRLSPVEVIAAAQIAVWFLPGPPSWFECLYRTRAVEVEAALNPWVLHEAKASQPGNGVRGALVMALRCPSFIRRGLLSGVTPLVLAGVLTNESTIKEVVSAVYEDGLILPADFDVICEGALVRIKTSTGRIQELSWLQLWAASRPHVAWKWFVQHLSTLSTEMELQVSDFAAAISVPSWFQQPLRFEDAGLLLEVANVLRQHGSSITSEGDLDSTFFGPPTKRMLEDITKGFVAVRGIVGRDALSQLIALETDSERQLNLRTLLAEHAELDASVGAKWDIARLSNIHTAFDSEPRNEAQLYEQALARLEEIRTSIEEGPFSERALFSIGMPEKHLQLWLAAKYQDTQNLRFSVHREEEVDDDKRTDIQLACAVAKVCVEIKPLDITRSYSANSLVEDTLKRQLVGQYLKGRNSFRGVLVLMQLDDKRWNLPNAPAQDFDELVQYLQSAADHIKLTTPTVEELRVFGIRCTK